MKLVFATICKYAENTDEGKFLNLMGAGIGGFRVHQLPTNLPPLYVAARVVHDDDELGKDQHICVALKNDRGAVVCDFDKSTVSPTVHQEPRQKSASNLLLILVGLPVSDDCMHYFEITHNGKVLGTIELDIILIKGETKENTDV